MSSVWISENQLNKLKRYSKNFLAFLGIKKLPGLF